MFLYLRLGARHVLTVFVKVCGALGETKDEEEADRGVLEVLWSSQKEFLGS